MVQIIEQTDEEKLAMYMKLLKEELAKMLIECNRVISNLIPRPVFGPPASKFEYWPFPSYGGPTVSTTPNDNTYEVHLAAGNGNSCDCKNLGKSTAGFYCHGYCKH